MMDTLKEARIARNLTQAKIASGLMTEATFGNVEAGKIWPKRSTRRKIELMIGQIDWVGTRLRGLEKPSGSDGVLLAMSEYVLQSTSAPAKDKIQFLKKALGIMEETI